MHVPLLSHVLKFQEGPVDTLVSPAIPWKSREIQSYFGGRAKFSQSGPVLR